MKYSISIILLLFYISCESSRKTLDNNIKTTNDVIGVISIDDNEMITVKLSNNSLNDKYLLTSYLNNRFTYNSNFYSSNEENFSITFLPFIEHLGTIKSHTLVVDESSVLKKNQAVFDFLKIKPQSIIEIGFDKNIWKEKFNFKDGNNIKIKLAIYDEINHLTVQGIELDERTKDRFLTQAYSYDTLVITSN